MKFKVVVITFFAFIIMDSAQADRFKPSHSCIKPIKPYKFTSEWEVTQYSNEVERYQRCISDFVNEQNKAIETHQKAAQDAIEDWNRYVQYELK